MENAKKMTISDVIEELRFNKVTALMIILACGSMIFLGYQFMLTNLMSTVIASTYYPEEANASGFIGSLGTVGTLGLFIGALIGGFLADRIGRKPVFVYALILMGLFSLLQMISGTYEMFAVMRVLTLSFGGAIVPVAMTIMAEIAPIKLRSLLVLCVFAFYGVGFVIVSFASHIFIAAEAPIIPGLCEQVNYITTEGTTATMYANWRVGFLWGATSIIWGVLYLLLAVESPFFVVKKGEKAVEANLNKLWKRVRGEADHFAAEDIQLPPRHEKVSITTIFKGRFTRITWAFGIMAAAGQFTIYGLSAWVVPWMLGIGYQLDIAIWILTVGNFATIVSSLLIGWIAELIGRRKALFASYIYMIVIVVIGAFFIIGPANGGTNSPAIAAALMLLLNLGPGLVVGAANAVQPESYPTELRGLGVSVITSIGRVGSVIAPILLVALVSIPAFTVSTPAGVFTDPFAWKWVALIAFGIPTIIGLLFVPLAVKKETKGESVDDIDNELIGKVQAGSNI